MKTLIQAGTVYDGSGSPPRQADVLIEGDRIIAVGQALPTEGARVIDAQGRYVTPGFVDIHRHCDIAVLTNPDFGETELAQGVTTTMGGNCGLAAVPADPAYSKAMYDYIEPVVGPIPAGMRFAAHADYANALARGPLPINMGFLVASGAVRTAVKGFSMAPYTVAELARAIALVEEGMQAGARGVSLGIMYQPECWSTVEELAAVARPAARANGILCTHIRGEGDSLIQSVQEVIDIAARAEIRLNISHLKATGITNWRDLIFRAIDRIEAARARGQEVTADFYPYTGGSTTLQSLLPPTVIEEDMSAMLAKMGTSQGKQELREELNRPHEGWDNMAASIGWDRIVISAANLPEHVSYQGKSLAELAESLRYRDPADLVADLLYTENGKVGIIVMSMSQEDVDDIARLPYTALISDSLYSGTANPHPRLNGAFPHFLRDFVLDRGVLSYEQAVHKMTEMPASRIGLADRGRIAAGCMADVLVYDPRIFTDKADYIHARRQAEGMDLVLINGIPVRQGGRPTADKAGRFLPYRTSL